MYKHTWTRTYTIRQIHPRIKTILLTLYNLPYQVRKNGSARNSSTICFNLRLSCPARVHSPSGQACFKTPSSITKCSCQANERLTRYGRAVEIRFIRLPCCTNLERVSRPISHAFSVYKMFISHQSLYLQPCPPPNSVEYLSLAAGPLRS